MKKITLLLFVLLLPASPATANSWFNKIEPDTVMAFATAPLVYCTYKAINGSKIAKTILKGLGAAACTTLSACAAHTFSEPQFSKDQLPLMGAIAFASGLGACALGESFINDFTNNPAN